MLLNPSADDRRHTVKTFTVYSHSVYIIYRTLVPGLLNPWGYLNLYEMENVLIEVNICISILFVIHTLNHIHLLCI